MEDTRRPSPILVLLTMCLLVGGGLYFAQNYKIAGLDHLEIKPKSDPPPPSPETDLDDFFFVNSMDTAGKPAKPASFVARPDVPPKNLHPLKLASWALSGFGPTKFANDQCRLGVMRILQQYDIIALQQITAAERDLVPRLVDELNEGTNGAYDFVLGGITGPPTSSEQLAILFNKNRVRIDRSQTYTVADPQNQMTYDPMVAWFRAAEPPDQVAWTFSVVNVRINLARAPAEVALLPGIFSSVRLDGRNEDDVVMMGLFQADDTYLLKRTMGDEVVAVVRSSATDIFGRHQTSNILVDRNRTNEFIGRGGPFDFLRQYNLTLGEAEAISSHLPVFGEFTPWEGGI
ncbi:deoxyribonuclease I [Rhodopirellula sp. MGV]|uniref:deoxyribonuclease I n=1 Tax=Rhodopirellula sp. MGV TaxID=2023130 RepID=UPI000B97A4D7|nr:deoxyribonuclease I [Rhodopirellula sp. MGV]OYP36345.1 deoxyribonuclease I [Rhodopirellula sp. MGV]PNY38868.1 deoxyribonuclease I [Rhodopirellula baltica]